MVKFVSQDGVVAHSVMSLRNALKVRFPDRWIGEGGPTRWPQRRQTFNHCFFFHVRNNNKSRLHRENPRFASSASVTTVTPEMLQLTWQ